MADVAGAVELAAVLSVDVDETECRPHRGALRAHLAVWLVREGDASGGAGTALKHSAGVGASLLFLIKQRGLPHTRAVMSKSEVSTDPSVFVAPFDRVSTLWDKECG